MFKEFDYMESIASDLNFESSVIYGGKEVRRRKNYKVYGWDQIYNRNEK
jgi:hypothetical protein